MPAPGKEDVNRFVRQVQKLDRLGFSLDIAGYTLDRQGQDADRIQAKRDSLKTCRDIRKTSKDIRKTSRDIRKTSRDIRKTSPGHRIDRYSLFRQNAKSPAGGPSAFQSAPPPGGTGGGDPPHCQFLSGAGPAVQCCGRRGSSDLCLLPVARRDADGGDP